MGDGNQSSPRLKCVHVVQSFKNLHMTIPDRLPIMRMEDYHTHYLGQASDGRLFWAYQTYLFTRPYADIARHDNWQRHRKDYAVLHTFDKDGNYLATKYWCAGSSTATDDRVIEAKLREFVSELGETIFTDIE